MARHSKLHNDLSVAINSGQSQAHGATEKATSNKRVVRNNAEVNDKCELSLDHRT